MTIQWDKISRYEADLIGKIVDRGLDLAHQAGLTDISKSEAFMDISAAHINCPMHLHEFLAAPAQDFGHDFFGIRRHINRRTGKLEHCFCPRCAIPDDHITLEAVE